MEPDKDTPTPRTDVASFELGSPMAGNWGERFVVVPAHVARQLEMENAELRKALETADKRSNASAVAASRYEWIRATGIAEVWIQNDGPGGWSCLREQKLDRRCDRGAYAQEGIAASAALKEPQ